MNATSIESLQALSPTEFEDFVKMLLTNMGFSATTTSATGDGGIDIIAVNEQPIFGGKYVIQCKRYAVGNNVGEPTIRDLFGVMHAENANKGILITTSDFSKQAVAFAQNKAIELINGLALLSLLNKYLAGIEETFFSYVANNQSEKYAVHFAKFQDDCDLILKREAYSVRNDKIQISSASDKFYSIYHLPEADISEYLEDHFILLDVSADSFFKSFESEGVEEALLEIWRSFMEKDDVKVSKGFVNEYALKTLSLYRECNRIQSKSMPEWFDFCVLKLALIYKVFKAAKELEVFENPLLINFILKSRGRSII